MITLGKTQGMLLEAVAVAARAHEGQWRKDLKTPYASHPFRVCLVVREIFGFSDPRMLMTAILHDTIEDTTTDFDDLEEIFGAEIAQWVSLLSKDKRLPEAEREQTYCRALENAPWQVKACKLADIFDNLMDLDTMSPDRYAHFLERARMYLDCLQIQPAEELHEPLALVLKLLQDRQEQRKIT